MISSLRVIFCKFIAGNKLNCRCSQLSVNQFLTFLLLERSGDHNGPHLETSDVRIFSDRDVLNVSSKKHLSVLEACAILSAVFKVSF